MSAVEMRLSAAKQEQIPTAEELVARAKTLAPKLRERAVRAERERNLPAESVQEYIEAGLVRTLMPKRWGGYEHDHEVEFDIAIELGRSTCGSSAWVLNYFTDHAEVLWQVPLALVMLAVYYAAIGVALASLTDRRIVGGVAILGLALVTSGIAGIFEASAEDGTALAVINVLALPLSLRDLIFLGHISADSGLSGVSGGGVLAVTAYLVVLLSAVALLLHRYREVDL